MNIKSSYVISFMINLTIVFCIIQNSFYGNEHFIIKTIIGMIPFLYIIGIAFMSSILILLCLVDFILNASGDYSPMLKDGRESLSNLHYCFTKKHMKIYRCIDNIFFISLFAITGYYFLCVLEIVINIITYFIGVTINSIHDKITEGNNG